MATFTKAKWGSLPSYPLPEEYKDPMSYLRHLVREGARRHFNLSDITSGDILSRVNRELDVISKGFPVYLLIVRDYMRFARAKPGFMDINNGPICGSLVAYLREIRHHRGNPAPDRNRMSSRVKRNAHVP